MPLPDLVVRTTEKEKTALSKAVKTMLSMKAEDENVRPVRFCLPSIEGEFAMVSFVLVPAVNREEQGPSDRTFTREASYEEDQLGAETDNRQQFRVKDGVEERRVDGKWVRSLGVTVGKASIPAHVHIFGHKDGIVVESLGHVLVYTSPGEYVVGVHTTFGPVPRTIRIVTE
ncbi:MAG: hypothetical protein MJZ38_01660 [archaeon]|nr:hypothetical protein [archaeon]